jgi:hypothetical protein
MDFATLRAKLDSIAEELEQETVAIEEEVAEEDEDGNVIPHDEIEENSYNDYMKDLAAREKAAGVSDDFYTRAGQDVDALMKAYADKMKNKRPPGLPVINFDDPTTKIPQVPNKLGPDGQYDGDDLGNAPTTTADTSMAGKPGFDDNGVFVGTKVRQRNKLDDPTTKIPQVAKEEAVEEATVEIPVQELADIMQLAGYANYAERIEEYANEPDEQYQDAEAQMIGLSGGLNGPKAAYAAAAGGDNPMQQEPTEIEEENPMESVEDKLYKSYQAFLEEAEITVED